YFYKAIKKEFPSILCIADIRGNYPADLVDDHIYSSPQWFWDNDDKYASFSRKGPKVYVGEYAVTQECGLGNLRAGLAEAAFMTGFEKNSDLVRMSSYAPLFVNVNNQVWNPDSIRFDNHQSFGTASYWVQEMFSSHRIAQLVPVKTPSFPSQPVVEPKSVEIGIGTWNTKAEFSYLRLTSKGKTFSVSQSPTHYSGSKWNEENQSYSNQKVAEPSLCLFYLKNEGNSPDYTFNLDAKKVSGDEGFLICVKGSGANTYIWWNIGGWGNTAVAVEKSQDGGKSELTSRLPFKVETGKAYHIQVSVKGNSLKLYIDGKLVQSASDSNTIPAHFASDAGLTADGHL
ncbi:MAG: alpha-L-arabinofuranosidase C-terminal domain-containing protein, partial [Rhabdochlamydiaceae bacterium]